MSESINNFHCRICNNSANNRTFIIKEKMFDTGEKFTYIKCSNCECMQLFDEHTDMHKHYPENYFSYNDQYKPNKIKDFFGKQYIKYRLGMFSPIGMLCYAFLKNNSQTWIQKGYFGLNSKILDVGCGNGRLIHLLSNRGFKNITGVEPYNKREIVYANNVIVHNKTIYDINEKFDFIMLHYSLEHMSEPNKVLQKLSTLLADDGFILIRVPIINCYAWRKYGINWVQMDAPRHVYIYSIQSLIQICALNGFALEKTTYDSTEYQFIHSERYLRGIRFTDQHEYFLLKEKQEFKKAAKKLNAQRDGDQVSCYFRKIKK